MKRGFTLLETVLYMALMAMMLGSALLATYEITTSASKLSSNDTTEEEGNFVLRKIEWALSGTSTLAAVLAPAANTYANTLSIKRWDGLPVLIRKNGSAIEISEDGITYYPLTSSNVVVASLQFHAVSVSGLPAGVEASTTINGAVFYTKSYARK